jgi:signal transduction histidine kinase
MRLKIIFIISFLLFCGNAISQTNFLVKKDSILFLLKNAKGKNQLSHLKRAVDLANDINNDSLIKLTNIKYGLQCFLKKDTKGLDISQQNLNLLYIRSKDSFALAKVHHYKALIHLLNFVKDSSLYYYVESKNISILLKDSLEVGRRLLSMTNIQRDGKDYLGSELSAVEGLQFLEPISDFRYTGSLYNSLGMSSLRTNRNKEARAYFNKSLETHKKNPSARRKYIAKFNFYSNSAISYINERNYDKAILLYNEGLKLDSLEVKFPFLYSKISDNLSDAYLLKGELTNVLERLKFINKIKTKINDLSGLSSNHQIQFIYYSKIDDSKNALYHAKKALEYARKSKYTRREVIMLSALSKSKFINIREANNYLRRYIKINDSVLKNEKKLKDQFAKVRYETGKKEKENINLKLENESKQLLLEKEKQQKIIGFLIAIGSLFLFAFSIVVFRNRRKKLTFEAQLQKAEAREKERKQIAKSLHDEVAGDIRVIHQQLEKSNQIEIAENLDKVKNTVRDLSHQLSSVSFDDVTFKDQIINLVSDYFSSTFKIKVDGIDVVIWSEIENPIKRTLFLCVRECIQNSVKHANATKMNITFSKQKNCLQLFITDNGSGFDSNIKKNGIGLTNLTERVEELNGRLSTESKLEEGTKITIEIPLNA